MLLVNVYKIPTGVAMLVTAGLIVASVIASVLSSRPWSSLSNQA